MKNNYSIEYVRCGNKGEQGAWHDYRILCGGEEIATCCMFVWAISGELDEDGKRSVGDHMKNTYTVREPGMSSWADDIKTLSQAIKELARAQDKGLHRARIIAVTRTHQSPVILEQGTVARLIEEKRGRIGALAAAEYQDRE